MSIDLERFCLMLSLAMPVAVALSVTIGVASCGWPSSSRVYLSGMASWPLINSPASSASAALAKTFQIILHGMEIAPLRGGSAPSGNWLGWEER